MGCLDQARREGRGGEWKGMFGAVGACVSVSAILFCESVMVGLLLEGEPAPFQSRHNFAVFAVAMHAVQGERVGAVRLANALHPPR